MRTTVKQLSAELKRTVESQWKEVEVVGEVYSCQQAQSGHRYISLKEDDTLLDAVCWRYTSTKDQITAGETMILSGHLTTYPGRSKYRLVVHNAQFDAPGTLLQKIEALKAKLAAAGLFDSARKKTLPRMPATVGIITSETGAVVEDMRLQFQRCMPAQLYLRSVTVQGESAATEIMDAIDYFVKVGADVIVIARGGGSLEDLAPFNDEALVRRVASCTVPIVSAIGHETDTTLCDHAADARASTPTAAPTIILPLKSEVSSQLQGALKHATTILGNQLQSVRQSIECTQELHRSILAVCDTQKQAMDYVQQGAHTKLQQALLQAIPKLPKPQLNREWIMAMRNKLASLDPLQHMHEFLDRQQQYLQLSSPERILKQGFCIVRSDSGSCKLSAGSCGRGEGVQLVFHDGECSAVVG